MQTALPQAFIWRRLHSLMGLWLVLFLMEHLFVNSQAALWIGDSGRGFVDAVNTIHNLPYLEVIECALLGVPILIHMVWGVKYLLKGKSISTSSDGSKPAVNYGRNRAYTWQRLTSWVLLVGLICHVAKFRFMEYPTYAEVGTQPSYFVRISMDKGLYTLAKRLDVKLYDFRAIEEEKHSFERKQKQQIDIDRAAQSVEKLPGERYNAQTGAILETAQTFQEKQSWFKSLTHREISRTEVIAEARDFGTASLLSVRDAFKSPLYVGLYTIFVLAAVFHASNGFWTFLITWGVILKASFQKMMVNFSLVLMFLLGFLGLAAIWGTYWLNLKS